MSALQKMIPAAFGANYDFRRMGTLLAVGAMTLLLGACAHNGGEAPALQWQFNASDAGSPAASPGMFAVESSQLADVTVESPAADAPAASEHSASPPACGKGGNSGWSDNCDVYRGGRDPVTGRAVTQL
jgi:cell division septation protein DedD